VACRLTGDTTCCGVRGLIWGWNTTSGRIIVLPADRPGRWCWCNVGRRGWPEAPHHGLPALIPLATRVTGAGQGFTPENSLLIEEVAQSAEQSGAMMWFELAKERYAGEGDLFGDER